MLGIGALGLGFLDEFGDDVQVIGRRFMESLQRITTVDAKLLALALGGLSGLLALAWWGATPLAFGWMALSSLVYGLFIPLMAVRGPGGQRLGFALQGLCSGGALLLVPAAGWMLPAWFPGNHTWFAVYICAESTVWILTWCLHIARKPPGGRKRVTVARREAVAPVPTI